MRPLSKAKERLDIFDKKSFEKLPHVNDLLKRISVDGDGKYSYQNIILPDFENAKERISAKKTCQERSGNAFRQFREQKHPRAIGRTRKLHFRNLRVRS